ncbi:dynein axonemal assembly factor 11 isoform X2 [Hydra vulgaris]|uniref:dynein axonemal assembly factor 11 isoform X2 n=1 Tax=Hydra vulgaris TaxID=6087 RepID=UPI001F5F4C99|nr:dynein axonemal assembly factor 11 isoform X1 [Hydra vulgaris]
MVFITEDLVRKRAEHNNCELSTLEEVSLHQLDIEKIEYLDKWCREIRILYLQSNLIMKIENLSRLKKLEYLNLALNNITLIENLNYCESLAKLDLTVNFIGKVTSVENLKYNGFLTCLYLTGNPCTDFIEYRNYVIATLPQLTHLDGQEISKKERILAMQNIIELRCDMLRQEKTYFEKKEKENLDILKEAVSHQSDSSNKTLQTDKGDFWSKPCKYTPESRLETHKYLEEQKKAKENEKCKFGNLEVPKRLLRYFNDEGKPLNINQPQISFKLEDDEENAQYILDVGCYKHLDPSLIDIDLQPSYVRITLKGKVFQLVFDEEVSPDRSSAKRSKVTGSLVLTLAKAKALIRCKKKEPVMPSTVYSSNVSENKKHKKLEVEKKTLDIYNICVNENDKTSEVKFRKKPPNQKYLKALENFTDDISVPPLE